VLGDVTATSKSAIVTRAPSGFLGVSVPDASRTVRRTEAQNPIGSGFIVGVTVIVQAGAGSARPDEVKTRRSRTLALSLPNKDLRLAK
jgi:hypothetical protein